jgi:hypothetical protein
MTPSTYISDQDLNRERYVVIRMESGRFIAELVEPDEAAAGGDLRRGEPPLR